MIANGKLCHYCITMLFDIHKVAIQCFIFLFGFNKFDDFLNISTQFLFLQVFLNLESLTIIDNS